MRREGAQRVAQEQIVEVTLGESRILARLAQRQRGLDADERHVVVRRGAVLRLNQLGVEPEEEVTGGDAAAADAVDGEIRSPENAARPKDFDRGAEGLGFADGGGVNDGVVKIRERMQAASGVSVAEAAGDVCEDDPRIRIASAKTAELLLVALILHRPVTDDVEDHGAPRFVQDLPHPLRCVLLDGGVHRVRAVREAVIHLDPAEPAVADARRHVFAVVGRSHDPQGPAQGRAILSDLVGHPGIERGPVPGAARHAEVEAVQGAVGEVALHPGAVLGAAEDSGVLQEGPGAGRKVRGVERMGVDVVGFRRQEAGEPGARNLFIARGHRLDEGHEGEGEGAEEEAVGVRTFQSKATQSAIVTAPPVNTAVIGTCASRNAPPA